jgi:hypothetical protein
MARDRVVLVGDVITATGLLHVGLGAVSFAGPLGDMVAAGLVNSMGGFVDRQATLWYFVAGGFLLTAGLTTRWIRRRTGVAPLPLGWGLIVIAALGAAVAPVSGFWLVLIEGVLLVVAGRSRRTVVADA